VYSKECQQAIPKEAVGKMIWRLLAPGLLLFAFAAQTKPGDFDLSHILVNYGGALPAALLKLEMEEHVYNEIIAMKSRMGITSAARDFKDLEPFLKQFNAIRRMRAP
jgi:hypothetical protein